jgi:hypothetical protein
MKPEYSTALAFIAASAIPAAYLGAAFPLSGERDLGSVVGTFVVVYWFSFIATAVIGVPAFLLLGKFNLVAWWSAIACGAFAGFAAYAAVVSGNSEPQSAFRYLGLGACSGLAFWLVLRSGQAWPAAKRDA